MGRRVVRAFLAVCGAGGIVLTIVAYRVLTAENRAALPVLFTARGRGPRIHVDRALWLRDDGDAQAILIDTYRRKYHLVQRSGVEELTVRRESVPIGAQMETGRLLCARASRWPADRMVLEECLIAGNHLVVRRAQPVRLPAPCQPEEIAWQAGLLITVPQPARTAAFGWDEPRRALVAACAFPARDRVSGAFPPSIVACRRLFDRCVRRAPAFWEYTERPVRLGRGECAPDWKSDGSRFACLSEALSSEAVPVDACLQIFGGSVQPGTFAFDPATRTALRMPTRQVHTSTWLVSPSGRVILAVGGRDVTCLAVGRAWQTKALRSDQIVSVGPIP